jgi:hypothetical protein
VVATRLGGAEKLMKLRSIFENAFVLGAHGFVLGAILFWATTPIGDDNGRDGASARAAVAMQGTAARR